MNEKLNNYKTPADRDCKSAIPSVPTGQLKIKGGSWQKHDLVNSILKHYLESSPKYQARQLGGHKPYIKGTHTAELKIKFDLDGSYGRLGNSLVEF